ncbi:hypothetical protein EU528_08945 [Candidatus Thorarchaeota archaeon]|nr:MAG: hypothetical protein EU528_08945 [Candidatus Thorarchaeota archaeon]
MVKDSKTGNRPNRLQSKYELGILGLVKNTVNLWARNLPQYIVIVGLTGVALAIVQGLILFSIFGITGFALMEFIGSSPIDSVFSLVLFIIPSHLLIPLFVLTLVGLGVYAIIAGGAIHYAKTDYENPGSSSIKESLSFSVSLAVPLIAVQLLQSLILVGLTLAAVLMMYVDSLITLVMIFFILYIAARLTPALAIVIAEERFPINALSRSWQLTGGVFWHVFFGQLLMVITVIMIDIAIAVGMSFILPFVIAIPEIVVFIVTLISSLVVSSINYIYLAVLFKDLEARNSS